MLLNIIISQPQLEYCYEYRPQLLLKRVTSYLSLYIGKISKDDKIAMKILRKEKNNGAQRTC